MGRPITFRVELTDQQEIYLENLTSRGTRKARVLKRAQILLMSHRGMTDQEIMAALQVSPSTVKGLRKSFAQKGLEPTLHDAPRPGRPPKYDGKDRAAITSLACTQAPKGYAKWSIRLIANRAVELNIVDDIAHSTVFYILKKTLSRRIAKDNGASRS